MKADHTQPELSLGNHVWEFLEPEPYASFGRGERACLKGVKHTQGGAQITKKNPISASSPSPGSPIPLDQNADIQNSQSIMVSLQRASFTDLLSAELHVAQGWERPELWERQGSRWQGALRGIAQPLKTMLSSPR